MFPFFDIFLLIIMVLPNSITSSFTTSTRYAFVIHTRSPLPGASPDAALVELCVGLGESLVSNAPGRALSASVEGRWSGNDGRIFP